MLIFQVGKQFGILKNTTLLVSIAMHCLVRSRAWEPEPRAMEAAWSQVACSL